jgi:hypothetical protein
MGVGERSGCGEALLRAGRNDPAPNPNGVRFPTHSAEISKQRVLRLPLRLRSGFAQEDGAQKVPPRRRALVGGRSNGTGGRGEDEAVADEGETLLWELGLKELIVGAGEELGLGAGDGRDEVMDSNGLAVEGALLVAIGSDLDGLDRGWLNRAVVGSGLLGEDGPKAGARGGWRVREFDDGLERAGIEIGEQDGGRMKLEAGGGGAAIGRDVEQKLGRVDCGGEVDGGGVDCGTDLGVAETA